jgi:hypothetical protein
VRGSFRTYWEKDKDRSFEEVWSQVIKAQFPQAPNFALDTSVQDMMLALKTTDDDSQGKLTLEQFHEIILILEQGVSQGFEGGGRLALGVGLQSFLYRLRSIYLTEKARSLLDKPGDPPKPEAVLVELIADLSKNRDPRKPPELKNRREEEIEQVLTDLRQEEAQSPEGAHAPVANIKRRELERQVAHFGYYWGPRIAKITSGVIRTIKFLRQLKKSDSERTSEVPVPAPPTAETPSSRLAT